jgi:putative ABC transport system permease protein
VFFLARKNLVEQPVRLLISIGGVGLSVMLTLVMWAILEGILNQAGAFVKNTDAQVWIVQKGFTDIAHGFSVVPSSLNRQLDAIPGVKRANPITGARTEVPTDNGKQSLSVIGYDTKSGVGGPWRFAGKPAIPKPGEVVLDETFAKTADVSVGDQLELPDRTRRVVALSAGTNQFTNQLSFGELRDVQKLVRLRGDVNFFALQVEPGAARRVIARVRRTIPGVTAFSKPTFVTNNEREIKEGFEPILYVMVGIAFFVGLAVVGLTMYTAAVEKAREYGVMSAIGADRGDLSGIILRQSAITSSLGFALGCLLVLPAAWVISQLAPKTELAYPLWLFGMVAAASIVMALLASVIPIRRLANLDPAAVFRA